MRDVPVFIVTGFLEGGKTSFIKEILSDPNFTEDEKITLISCETGIEEYEEDQLKKNNTTLVEIDEKEELTSAFLEKCDKDSQPTKIIIEYNGMWPFEVIEKLDLPEGWGIAQIITPIDSSTYESYMSNMKSLLMEQYKISDLVIFNRCNEKTDKLKFRNTIKSVNPQASIMFELENGEIDESPLALPFDINADVIEFNDYDFGVWYMDLMENPPKYEGKNIKIKGFVNMDDRCPDNIFYFGRNAMTCCEDDIAFLGVLCQCKDPHHLKSEEWIEAEGKLHMQVLPKEKQIIPVLTVKKFNKIDKLEDELVYF